MKTYIIVYNAETDFIRAETDHPETLIIDLLKEGYFQEEIELYEVKELTFEVTFDRVGVKINA